MGRWIRHWILDLAGRERRSESRRVTGIAGWVGRGQSAAAGGRVSMTWLGRWRHCCCSGAPARLTDHQGWEGIVCPCCLSFQRVATARSMGVLCCRRFLLVRGAVLAAVGRVHRCCDWLRCWTPSAG